MARVLIHLLQSGQCCIAMVQISFFAKTQPQEA